MSMLVDLADVARGAGLEVLEIPGWTQRTHPGGMKSDGPRCVVVHHTAGAAQGDSPSLMTVRLGRPDLEGPLAHFLVARSGAVHVVAAGLCWHTGATRETWQGNAYSIGLEAEHTGDPDVPWPAVQLDSMVRLCRALCARYQIPHARVLAHREIAVFPPGHPRAGQLGRKIDPAGIDMRAFRAKLAAREEITMPTAEQIAAAVWSHERTNGFGDTVSVWQVLDAVEQRVVKLQAEVAALRAERAQL